MSERDEQTGSNSRPENEVDPTAPGEDRSRQRLGRGLASLIGTGAEPKGWQPASGRKSTGGTAPPYGQSREAPSAGGGQTAVPAEQRVALDRIRPNPANPRSSFDDTDLGELADSIRQHGVVQPLLVRVEPGRSDRYELVAGERRWRAARLAGLSEVPIVLRSIDDRQALEIAIIENVQRTDLTAVDEALGYQRLIDEHGYTQADLAEVLAKSRSHVANTLRLLRLPGAVRDMVASGALSPGAARTLVTASDPLALARTIVSRGLSVRQAEELARGETEAGKTAADADAGTSAAPSGAFADASDADNGGRRTRKRREGAAGVSSTASAAEVEHALSRALAMPVAVTGDASSGSIRVEFRDANERDRLLSLLQGR